MLKFYRNGNAMERKVPVYGLLTLFVMVCCVGCAKDHLDPTQIGRFRPVPIQNMILSSLWVGDEPDPTWAGAEEPRPEDLIAYDKDYIFAEGDIIRISIYELLQEGVPYINDYQVTETGKISIPDVGVVQAKGLTEKGLEDEVKDILQPALLKDPTVTVLLQQSQKLVYSISGEGVVRSGQYAIPRYDYRLSRAIAVAGGMAQFNASNIYVTRRVSGEGDLFEQLSGTDDSSTEESDLVNELELMAPPTQEDTTISPEDEMFEVISPSAKNIFNDEFVITTAEMVSANELEALADPDASLTAHSEASTETAGRIEWIFEDGKWIPVTVGGETVDSDPLDEPEIKDIVSDNRRPVSYSWDEIGSGGTQTRVIKIPRSKLFGGDPRYDIIIRPNDSIMVPVDVVGEFYVMGNSNNQGGIPLTGRPITLKQAVALAGGLGQLAIPKKVEVTRRIGEDQEITVMVDLDKIAKGLQPDFFIKPYDLINFGTDGKARFLAILRNAFRASYGFGFVYDRNFAHPEFD